MARVIDRAHARGLHAIVTVFSVELVPEAETLPWDAYKTASPDIIHKPLLDALAATGKPLIVSTGASTMPEVERTMGWLSNCRERIALLQCVSCYPVPVEQAALGGIRELKAAFAVPVGYSDHTTSPRAGLAAAFAGASLLEKHITHDRRAAGPDHAASFEPSTFREYVSHVRANEAMNHSVDEDIRLLRALADVQSIASANMGERFGRSMREVIASKFPGSKEVSPLEQDVRTVSRQSLVTTRPLPADHRITRDDLTIKRPGTGLEPWRLDEIVGRQTARPADADVPLLEDDLVPAR
jgi:sialic acid synthase SpsE